MSSPRPISVVLDLLHDLVQERPRLSVGPARLEIAGGWLGAPEDEPPELTRLWEQAAYLGLDWSSAPTGEELRLAAAWAESYELYLDLRLPAGASLSQLPDEAARRTARIVFESASPHLLLEARTLAAVEAAAAAIEGRVLVRLRATAEEARELAASIEVLGRAARPLDLHVLPQDSAAAAAIEGRLDELEQAARKAGLNVSVRGLARWPLGKPHDHLLVWNVQRAFFRKLFQDDPLLCPFPFLMLRHADAGPLRLCPVPEGPAAEAAAGEDPWNAPAAMAVRQRFFEREPPAACRRCTLLPRLLRSLQSR